MKEPHYDIVESREKIPLRDRCELSATVLRPRSTTPDRAIILVHGFAAEKTENGLFPPLARTLAQRGFLTIAYDWRGLGESQGDFSTVSLETHVQDLIQVLQWCESLGITRLSPIGFSLGATLTALAFQNGVTTESAVFLSPALRPSLDMWPRYDTLENARELTVTGFISKNGVRVGRSILHALRDTDLAASGSFELSVPLLVCHGSADTRIPFETSARLFSETSKDSRITFRPFSGASHSFKPEQEHRKLLTDTIVDWLADGPGNARS